MPVSPTALADLQAQLGARCVTDPEELARVAGDESRFFPEGPAAAAVFAEQTEDVSIALRWANTHGVPVSVRGGGTGLAGGAVCYPDGLIVSLERMTGIGAVDVGNRLVEVEPGVITQDLDTAVRAQGFFFAPDPASVAISTVGGNIATNAGGLRCITHGVTRDSVAALEVVLADGSVINTGARTRKNVVGLDLTSLFVGSEGTLGIITKALVRLQPIPEGEPRTFRADFDDIVHAGDAVTAIANHARKPEVLELMDADAIRVIEQFQPSGLNPPQAAMLIGRTVGPDALAHAEELLALCREHGAVDTQIALDDSLIEARRIVNPALSAQGLRVSCDVGVPIAQLSEMFRRVDEISAAHNRRILMIAHAGDGNLHPMVEAEDTPEGYEAAEGVLTDITKLALELGGTITGEHGIGAVKHHELPLQLSEATIGVQRSIKRALDPNNILTPGRAI